MHDGPSARRAVSWTERSRQRRARVSARARALRWPISRKPRLSGAQSSNTCNSRTRDPGVNRSSPFLAHIAFSRSRCPTLWAADAHPRVHLREEGIQSHRVLGRLSLCVLYCARASNVGVDLIAHAATAWSRRGLTGE